jgi:hypothetical protein
MDHAALERGSFLHCQKMRVDGGLPDEHRRWPTRLVAGAEKELRHPRSDLKNPPYRS